MLHRQRGALNLFWVGIGSALLAAVAMAALFSMRYERNLFAEGAAKLGKMADSSPAAGVIDAARNAASGTEGGGALKKCVIDGRTVISNTDCKDANPTSKKIAIHDTKGIEAPKAPPVEKQAGGPGATSNPMIDKIIEKQLR